VLNKLIIAFEYKFWHSFFSEIEFDAVDPNYRIKESKDRSHIFLLKFGLPITQKLK
tara:strand:+ start:2610 stop:2777 length:168 start_codon:yes stop_codon:yes gene_type:complete